MAIDKNKHLDCVLASHNIENDVDLMKAYRNKRDQVREDLKQKFSGQFFSMIHSGSYKKWTAINIKFDMDLVVPFKKDTDTLKNLYNAIFEYFDVDYRKIDKTLINVKRQKVAVGLEFMVNNKVLDLDIVPAREIVDYEEDNDLNLFVNEKMGTFEASTTLKTNIFKQIDNIKNNANARETIKLLKIWKRRNNGSIKSFLIELIALDALKEYSGNSDRWSKLKYVMEYIKDNVKSVRLVDPGNSNNVVSDSLDDNQKDAISATMKWILHDIESNDSSLERYFPINPDFPCKQDKRSIYIVGSTTRPDKLNNEDFG